MTRVDDKAFESVIQKGIDHLRWYGKPSGFERVTLLIHAAVQKGRVSQVEELLSLRVLDVDSCLDERSRTCLQRAISIGRLDVTEVLLRHRASTYDLWGERLDLVKDVLSSRLYAFASKRRLFELLDRYGFEWTSTVGQTDKRVSDVYLHYVMSVMGRPALSDAERRLYLWLNDRCYPNDRRDAHLHILLDCISDSRGVDRAIRLIKEGAHVNTRCVECGETVLHKAVLYGTPEQVRQIIVDLGCDIHADGYDNQTAYTEPYDVAVRERPNEMIAPFHALPGFRGERLSDGDWVHLSLCGGFRRDPATLLNILTLLDRDGHVDWQATDEEGYAADELYLTFNCHQADMFKPVEIDDPLYQWLKQRCRPKDWTQMRARIKAIIDRWSPYDAHRIPMLVQRYDPIPGYEQLLSDIKAVASSDSPDVPQKLIDLINRPSTG